MSRKPLSLAVNGSIKHTENGSLFLLSKRVEGHDTFLTGSLEVDGEEERVLVRILSFDDVTVLHPTTQYPIESRKRWSGTLHLPHGLHPRLIPRDLQEVAEAADRRLDALDTAEIRYALRFLEEATTDQIRVSRIDAIVRALPPREEKSA